VLAVGVLIADGERLNDPRAYHDRLLLGLSGIMSEAELHQIKGQSQNRQCAWTDDPAVDPRPRE
jgi:hypothetical protein